jgi:hypothetical protein
MVTIKEIEKEFNRIGYKLTFDNVIINRVGAITHVRVLISKTKRLQFANSSNGNFLVSYPLELKNIVRFLNEYWFSNVK